MKKHYNAPQLNLIFVGGGSLLAISGGGVYSVDDDFLNDRGSWL